MKYFVRGVAAFIFGATLVTVTPILSWAFFLIGISTIVMVMAGVD